MGKQRRRPRKHDPASPRPAPPSRRRPGSVVWTVAGGAAVLALTIWAFSRQSEGPPAVSAERVATKRLIAGDPGFVDPATCGGCHAEIAATYQQTGMGRSFYPATPETMAHLGDGAEFHHAKSRRTYRIEPRDGRYFLRRWQQGPDGKTKNVLEKEIHYVMGSGNHARSYLHQYPNGKVVELPLGWYADRGGFFAMSPGYDQPTHRGFRREVSFECMSCHNGYPAIEPGADAHGRDPLFPGRLPAGIDCQRCHGPGAAHVGAVAEERPIEDVRAAIFNPARESPERQLEVCMQCHLETTSRRLPYSIVRFDRGLFSYRPSEPLADYVLHFDHPPGVREEKFEIAHAAYRLRRSECFQQSEGMTCTTCHDPHHALRGEEAVAHFRQACRDCHQPALERLIETGEHPADRRCLDCHMPKRRTDDVVHVVMTDHFIQRRPPERDLLAPLEEIAEGPGEAYQGEVVPYYPPRLTEGPESELYLATAQVMEQTNLIEGRNRLERLIEQERPEEAAFYFQLAEAYWADGKVAEALPRYAQAVEGGAEPVYLRNYAVALSSAGRFDQAERVARRALELLPGDPKTLANLGEVLLHQGRAGEAATVLKEALETDPDSPEAWNNLAKARSDLGQPEAAEDAARRAVASYPDDPVARNTLGNLLAARGAADEAARQFEAALRADPGYAEGHYNYASLLASQEETREAERHLRKAIELRPGFAEAFTNLGNLLGVRGDARGAESAFRRAIAANPDYAPAHFNLGAALAAQERLEEAAESFQRALELDPGYDEARLNLAIVLGALGRTEEAKAHLAAALRSSNPQVRAAAEQVQAGFGQ